MQAEASVGLAVVDDDLRGLIDESLKIFRNFRGKIVSSSMPILFFGDLDRYARSETPKIITVGLNPSPNEFPRSNPFERFPLMRGWESQRTFDYANCRKSLCRYFYGDRYEWFDYYEDVLRGVGSSYFRRGIHNVAIHTDFCSPVATSETWSELDLDTREGLKRAGRDLWLRLVQYLKPKLILASIGFNEHLRDLGTAWKTIPVPIVGRNCRLRWLQREFDSNLTHIVYGKPIRGQPFAGLVQKERIQVGEFIYAQLCSS